MASTQDGSSKPTASTGRGLVGHVRTHGAALALVAGASGIGALAAFAFQIVTARYLGPADFGLLSAFFAIVNVAAVGSSSLQNSVTVETAVELADSRTTGQSRRWPVDALIIGIAGGAVVAALSAPLADALNTSAAVIVAAAICVPLSFLFADFLGLIQGTGNAVRAVLWSTISLVARVIFVVIALLVGYGLGGVITAVVAATAVAVVGAAYSAQKIRRPSTGVFSTSGVTVIALTVAFAWLISADVFFMRAGAPEQLAGSYASAIVLVKAGFLLPATLSLYLLPRFVRNRGNRALTRVGVLATLALTALTSLAMIAFFALFGNWLLLTLYGDAYERGAALLVPVALAYLPWIMAQGMLIRMTAFASRRAAGLLVALIVAQWITFTALIPDVYAMLIAFGCLGAVALVTFIFLGWLQSRATPLTTEVPA